MYAIVTHCYLIWDSQSCTLPTPNRLKNPSPLHTSPSILYIENIIMIFGENISIIDLI